MTAQKSEECCHRVARLGKEGFSACQSIFKHQEHAPARRLHGAPKSAVPLLVSPAFASDLCDGWTHNQCPDGCLPSGWLVTVPDFSPGALMSQHPRSEVPVAAAARVHQLGQVLGTGGGGEL